MLRRGRPDGTATGRVDERLAGVLDEDETVAFRLRCSGPVRHDRPDGTERRLEPATEGCAGVAITGRRVLLVVETDAASTTVEIPYAEIRDVDAGDRWLGRTLEIAVRGEGVYRLAPDGSADLEAVHAFLADAAKASRHVATAMRAVQATVTDLGRAIEAGDREAARDHRTAVDDRVETARSQLSETDPTVAAILEERIREAVLETHRTRLRAHGKRGSRLRERARDLADDAAYDQAHDAARRARRHYEVALATALEWDVGPVAAIQTEIDDLDRQIERLEGRPLAAAGAALERARAASDPRAAVEAWRRALAAHRAALTAGWGTDAAFAGDTDALRRRIAWLVRRSIEAHRDCGFALVEDGNRFQHERSDRLAGAHYRAACEQLERARDLAAEFRAGDVDRLERELAWIEGLVGER